MLKLKGNSLHHMEMMNTRQPEPHDPHRIGESGKEVIELPDRQATDPRPHARPALVCVLMGGIVIAWLSMGSTDLLRAGENPTPPATKASAKATPKSQKGWRFTDIEGKDHEPFAKESVKFLVVVFIGTDCPISNYYQPTLNRLARRYEGKGVRFLLFHPDPDVTPEMLKEHAKAFGLESPVFADADFALASRLEASTVPEAFVIARDGQTKYRGRIDDTYAAWGKKRREPGSHDLRDALEAVLSGKAVASPTTKAIGCYIPLELAKKKR